MAAKKWALESKGRLILLVFFWIPNIVPHDRLIKLLRHSLSAEVDWAGMFPKTTLRTIS
jgi:hypothetical protein